MEFFLSRKIVIILFLVTFFLIQIIPFFIWLNRTQLHVAFDESVHLMIALDSYNKIFHHNDITSQQLQYIYSSYTYSKNRYPHLFHWSTLPFFYFFGVSPKSAVLVNVVYFLILLVSGYFIGKKLSSKKAGLLIAFLLSSLPMYVLLLKYYLIDLSLVSIIALTTALLFYSQNFRKTPFAFFAGVTFGLGLLTKQPFILYISIIPLGFFATGLCTQIKSKRINRTFFLNLFLFVLPIIIIAGTWYFKYFGLVKIYYKDFLFGGVAEGNALITQPQSYLFYFWSILFGFGFWYLINFILASYLIFKNKKSQYYLYILNIVFIYLAVSLIFTKDPRYIAPALLFLTIVTVVGLELIKNKKISNVIFALLIIIGFIQLHLSMLLVDKYSFYAQNERFTSVAESIKTEQPVGDFSIEKVLKLIQAQDADKKEYSTICLAIQTLHIENNNVAYFTFQNDYSFASVDAYSCDPLLYDYVISGPIYKYIPYSDSVEKIKNILYDNIEKFELVGSVQIYKEHSINVYKNKIEKEARKKIN